jgi:hypothetical protein
MEYLILNQTNNFILTELWFHVKVEITLEIDYKKLLQLKLGNIILA